MIKTVTDNGTKRKVQKNRIVKAEYIHGDSRIELDVLIAEKRKFHLIMTSPPYNIGKSYEEKTALDVYLQEQAKVIAECVRLLHPNGSICWQVGNHVSIGEIWPLDILLYPVFKKLDLKLRNRIIWHFEHGLHCSRRLSGRYETILWMTKCLSGM